MRTKWAARGSVVRVVTLAGLAAVMHAACGGKVVIEEELGAGGGSSSSKSSVSVGTSVTSTSVTSTGPTTVTASATTGGGSCVTCAEFITGEIGPLCPESEKYYDAFIACVCVKDKGCVVQCASNACVNEMATEACLDCVSTVCSEQFNTCANDT